MPYTLILERFQTFVTIFLGIFIEAVPFLLAGSVVSGLIEVYLKRETLFRLIPRQPVVAALMGASIGLLFPVCECGVVPVTRRLYQKGLPVIVSCCVADATPVGLIVRWPESGTLERNQWVEVSGKFEAGEFDGKPTAVLVAEQLAPTGMPNQPYLFP